MATQKKLDLGGFSNSSTAAGNITSQPISAISFKDLIDPTKTQNVNALGENRVKQIVSNLDTGFKNDAGIGNFSDVNKFRAAYDYGTSDAGKQAILDAYFKYKTPNQTNTQAQNVNQTGFTPLNITPQNQNINPTSANFTTTGNLQLDASLNSQKGSVNQYTGQVAQNNNINNQGLSNAELLAQQNQRDYERLSQTNAIETKQAVNSAADTATKELELRRAEEIVLNSRQIEQQEELNKKNIASANLLASLTGGTGGSSEMFFVNKTRNDAASIVRSIEEQKGLIDRRYQADLSKIQSGLLEATSKINTELNTNIFNARKSLIDQITTIEQMKGKNSKDALDSVYAAVQGFNNTVSTLTVQAAELKQNEIKLAEEKRQAIANEQLKLQQLNDERIKEKNRFELEVLAKQMETNPFDQEGVESFAQAIVDGKATIQTVPEEARVAVLNAVKLKELPPELRETVDSIVAGLPTALKNGDAERRSAEASILNSLKLGFTPEQAALKVSKVKGDAIKEPITQVIYDNLGADPFSVVVPAINAGKYKEAIQLGERIKMVNQFSKDQIDAIKTGFTDYERVKKILNSMSDKDKNKLGSIEQTINSFAEKFTDDYSNPKLTELRNALQNMSAVSRNAIFGASVTQGESGVSSAMFPDTNLNFTTINGIIDGNVKKLQDDYSNIRVQSGLPDINIDMFGGNFKDYKTFVDNPLEIYQKYIKTDNTGDTGSGSYEKFN